MTSRPTKTCAIVALDRPRARGGVKRIETWTATATALGYQTRVHFVNRTRADLKPSTLTKTITEILRGRRLVEAITASPSLIRQQVESDDDLTIVVTLRCVTDMIVRSKNPVVIDLVDDLARNYRGRSREASWIMRTVFAVLAPLTERAQRTMLRRFAAHPNVQACAAGSLDAINLGVSWQPIPVRVVPGPKPPTQRTYDIGFVGTMTYAPNVQAVSNLLEIMATLAQRQIKPTCVVAGSGIAPTFRTQLETLGITVIADPPDMASVLDDIKIVVAPLETATGIQIKLLEAGAARCAIVATDATLSGFDEFQPVLATPVDSFADRLAVLLSDGDELTRIADQWSAYVDKTFSFGAAQQRLADLVNND